MDKNWVTDVFGSIFGQIPAKWRGFVVVLLVLTLFAGTLDNLINRSYGLDEKRIDAQTATITVLQETLDSTNQRLGSAVEEIASLKHEQASMRLELDRCNAAIAASSSGNQSKNHDQISMGASVATRNGQ